MWENSGLYPIKTTSYVDKNGKIIEGGFTINTSDFVTENGKENKNKIAYRNYNFAFYKYDNSNIYTLGFYRIITGKATPNRAYLPLAADVTGGETPSSGNDFDISMPKDAQDAKPQVYNSYDVEYPNWDDSATTGIAQIDKPIMHTDSYYYTLQGTRTLYPMVPGIYIHNGKKIVIR